MDTHKLACERTMFIDNLAWNKTAIIQISGEYCEKNHVCNVHWSFYMLAEWLQNHVELETCRFITVGVFQFIDYFQTD